MALYLVIILLLVSVIVADDFKVNKIPPGEHYIPGRYIVTMDGEDDPIAAINDRVNQVSMTMRGSVKMGKKAFAFISGSEVSAKKLLSRGVTAVEQDMMMFVLNTANTESPNVCITQNVPSIWGLDRMDQLDTASDNRYIHGIESDGAGVTVYVLDTGVNINHSEFEGRASHGFTVPEVQEVEGDDDLNGHGTHVAGTVGSATYGVAKNVNIVAVKVLFGNGSGSGSGFIEAITWVIEQHQLQSKPRSVINLSLAFSTISTTVDELLQHAVSIGITVVVAAGNEFQNACNLTPAHLNEVITVGASTIYDESAVFSNFGSCLDIWAPGHIILSVNHTGDSNYLSGTSMACPHVAGAVARYISHMETIPTPDEVAHWLTSSSIMNTLLLSSTPDPSPNRLLYMPCLDEYTTPPMSSSTSCSGHHVLIVAMLLMLFNTMTAYAYRI